MKILIIEDEKMVSNDLSHTLTKVATEALEISQVYSVKEAITSLQNIDDFDLIFSDIQLGDGNCFQIFKAVKTTTPIIFCTAYDEYALEAFQENSIDYLLKPFSSETIQKTLQKFYELKYHFSEQKIENQFNRFLNLMYEKQNLPVVSSVLVYFQDKIIPINLDDIAIFYVEDEETQVRTFSQKTYFPNKSLDELQKIIGTEFFRASRQFLIHRKSIADVSQFFARKIAVNLKIPFEHIITVSKEKKTAFIAWMEK